MSRVQNLKVLILDKTDVQILVVMLEMWGGGGHQFQIYHDGTIFPSTAPVKRLRICWPILKACRVLTGPNDSYEMAAHTMTDPPPCLTPGKRHCGLSAFFGFHQTETGPDRKTKTIHQSSFTFTLLRFYVLEPHWAPIWAVVAFK